jgi:TIR domain
MAEAGAAEKLKVFISYSRKDSTAFVDELVLGLEDRGFTPILDRHDIKPGEPWEARLGGLIEQSDTVVFVVSPEAVKSERCGWEIDLLYPSLRPAYTVRRGKRSPCEAMRSYVPTIRRGTSVRLPRLAACF